ncbi:MAG: putative Hybrid histidine kinase, partial [Solirubrobacterales bacterium]|nr:putative Hybrid histidine kinase [Solirubrobacterales bacterium]
MDVDQGQAILNLAHSAFISMDEDGRIVYWNIRAEEMFGLTREQAIGRVLADTIIPERYHEEHRRGLRRFLETGEGPVLNKRIELSALGPDGSEFPVELTISSLREGDAWTFHGFVADISERHEAEQERQRLLAELERALHSTEERLS